MAHSSRPKKAIYKHEKLECRNQICPIILEAISFYMDKTCYVLKISSGVDTSVQDATISDLNRC